MKQMAENLAKLTEEVGGTVEGDPNRRPLRVRMHDLENDKNTKKMVTAALDAAKSTAESSNEAKLARRDRRISLLIAAAAVLFTILRPHLGF